MKNQLAVVRNLTNQILSQVEGLMYDNLSNLDVTFIISTTEKDFLSRVHLLENSRHVNIPTTTIFSSGTAPTFLRLHSAFSRIGPVTPVHQLNIQEVKKT